jgi:NTE family protein
MIVINASDLGEGARFSFTQEYFDLLCSDLSTYPVARAVAASSAVPVMFNPIVVQNYADCGTQPLDWQEAATARARGNAELSMIVGDLASYGDKEQRRYVHLVDGGITDNLGLRAVYEIVEAMGGSRELASKTALKPTRRFVLISVNASTDPEPEMDLTNRQPSLKQTIGAVTDAQLHRYNAATVEQLDDSMQRWARELSTPEQTVTPYFIPLSFRDLQEPDRRLLFNRMPTSFRLSDEQVDELIRAGREILRSNPEFQRLLADLAADQ